MIAKKYKHLLFSTFLIAFLCLSANSVFAMEVDFGLGPDPTLPQYASFFFTWLISIAGSLALVSFAIGAISFMISGDSPTLKSNSKDRMKGAILGLVLTLSSILILNTINPALTAFLTEPVTPVNMPVPPPQPGVYFYSGSGCSGKNSGPITTSQDKLSLPFSGDIKFVKIINNPPDIQYGVILHKEAGLKNGSDCTFPIMYAGICYSINVAASAADIFKLNNARGTSGDGATVYSETFGWNSGQNAGFENFSDGATWSLSPSWVVLGKQICFDYTKIKLPESYKHKCTSSNCGEKRDYTCNPSKPCRTGEKCNILDGMCWGENGKKLCSNNACETFQDCLGSIKIKGNYLVALYSKGTTDSIGSGSISGGSGSVSTGSDSATAFSLYCQTFTQNIPNLNAQPIVASGGKKLDSVYIIPIK